MTKIDTGKFDSGGDLDIKFDAPTGYRWVAAARKKDIQWQVMRKWEIECAKKDFYMHEEIFKSKIIPENCFFQIKGNKLMGYCDILYIEGETLESYLKRKHIVDTFKYPAITYGFLDDDGYHEEDYVWRNSKTRKKANKQKRKSRIAFRRKVDEYLESIPDETVIIGVDCHV